MNRRWIWWLIVALALPVLGVAIAYFILGGPAASPPTRGQIVAANGALLGFGALWVAWISYGLWSWRDRGWVKWAAVLFYGSLLVLGLFRLLIELRYPATAIGIAGVWSMVTLFIAGVFLIRVALTPGHPILGVARTLVDEALRMKIPMIFMLLMLVLVPLLPLLMNPDERLQYRMQNFLNYSLFFITFFLGLMTIFLACLTITSELSQRQIFLTLSKPVSRAQYLLGKWMGIAMLNLLLVAIGGLGVFVFARLLEVQPAKELADYNAVVNQVLVARNVIQPTPPGDMLQQRIAERARQLHASDPETYPNPLRSSQYVEIHRSELTRWHTIAPGDAQTYVFSGVDVAKAYGDRVQLRIKPRVLPEPFDGNARLVFYVNDRLYLLNSPIDPQVPMQWIGKQSAYHAIDLPLDAVADEGPDKGVLTVRIVHVNAANPQATHSTSVAFDPGEGLQLLFQVGTFEGNLVRGLFLIWLSLVFLAMLGLASGTFLGFPIASILCLLVFIGGYSTTFLYESVSSYGIADLSDPTKAVVSFRALVDLIGEGRLGDAFKMLVHMSGRIVLFIMPALGEYYPGSYLVDGRSIPARLLGEAALKIGLAGTGICAIVGWLIFRVREVARVIV